MSTHPLIQHATRRSYNETPTMPDGSVYDRVSGYWLSTTVSLWLKTINLRHTSWQVKNVTKKPVRI